MNEGAAAVDDVHVVPRELPFGTHSGMGMGGRRAKGERPVFVLAQMEEIGIRGGRAKRTQNPIFKMAQIDGYKTRNEGGGGDDLQVPLSLFFPISLIPW